MVRAICLSIILLAASAVCQAVPNQADVTLSERITAAIEQSQPSWKTLSPMMIFRHTLEPSAEGRWQDDGYLIVVRLSAYSSVEDAAKDLEWARRVSPSAYVPPASTHANQQFLKANVIVSIEVSLIDKGVTRGATAVSPTAGSIMSGVGRIVEGLIVSYVKVDGCVNELYQSPLPPPESLQEAFWRDVESGCLSRVEQELASGVDVNARNSHREPALAFAVANGHRDIMQLLLRANAKPDGLFGYRGPVIFQVLSRPSAYRSEDLLKIIANQISIMDDLLAQGANIEARDENGLTFLHQVARYNADDGSPAIFLKALIQRGANVNTSDRNGRTPIMDSVIQTLPKVAVDTLRILLAAGADVNARDASGKTVLTYAQERIDKYHYPELQDVMRILAGAGATK